MQIRNVAIIAHVDHGKTTLTDELLKQSGSFGVREAPSELVMDSGDQEKERGITITAKNCAINLPDGSRLNIIDTPGHADFGSEVERVLGMADACLLVVDAFEGPMPQTRFVLKHALARGLKALVIFNKIDKRGVDGQAAHNKVFDLFIELGATDEQCDFPYLFAIGREGRVGTQCNAETLAPNLDPLFQMIQEQVEPAAQPAGDLQMQITSLAYDNFLGRIAIGRISRGSIKTNDALYYENIDGKQIVGRAQKVFGWQGIARLEKSSVGAGDIAAVSGLAKATIGDTICTGKPEPLPRGAVEEPTLEVLLYANTSPMSGQDCANSTSRQLDERLKRELQTNVGLRVRYEGEAFAVSGRGELHLGVLLETMRREGMEMAIGKPRVLKNVAGEEPYEMVVLDCPEEFSGSVIQQLNQRGGEMLDMKPQGNRTVLHYRMPTRGLLGMRSIFTLETRGEGILSSAFDGFSPATAVIPRLRNGAMISGVAGQTTAFALGNLQLRATLFIGPQTKVYEGMVIGECNRDEELVVNPVKGKQLTNIRASGTDEAIKLTPPRQLTLEQSMEWIGDDELLEITPLNLRLRKRLLAENARRSSGRRKG